MGAVATPYGMYPRRVSGSKRNTAGCTHFPVTVDPGATIYYGAPVALVAGSVKPIATSPTTTGGVTSPVGVLQGAYWESAAGVFFSPHLPGGVIAGGGIKVVAMVNDDPDYVFMIQADGTLTMTAVGKNAALVNPGSGNTSNGRSTCALGASTVATTATLAVRVVRVLEPGAAFPDVLVQWNGGVHQYANGFAA